MTLPLFRHPYLRHGSVLPSKLRPRRHIYHHLIKYDKTSKNTKIPPDVFMIHTKPIAKLITIGLLAKLTHPIRPSLHIPTSFGDVRSRIRLTYHVWRR